jgi:hypothetical protein
MVQPGSEHELETEQKRLRRRAEELSVDDFVTEAGATLKQWENKPDEMYGRLAETIDDLLNSAPYSGDKTAKTATWQIAEQTLTRKTDEIPIPTVISLLYHLASEPLSHRNDWPAVRSQRAQWWLEAWNRLDQEIDPNFDPDDLPDLSPDTAALAKAEYYKQQFQLRQTQSHFKQTASRHLVHLYSLPPERVQELNALLKTFLSDATRNEYFPGLT